MEFIFEFIFECFFELFAEVILSVVGSVLGAILGHIFNPIMSGAVSALGATMSGVGSALGTALRHFFTPSEPVDRPLLAASGYLLFGAMAGGISLLFMPKLLARRELMRYANLVTTPLIVGLVMGRVGAWRRSHDKEVIRLESVGYGALFALGMVVVRFLGGR